MNGWPPSLLPSATALSPSALATHNIQDVVAASAGSGHVALTVHPTSRDMQPWFLAPCEFLVSKPAASSADHPPTVSCQTRPPPAELVALGIVDPVSGRVVGMPLLKAPDAAPLQLAAAASSNDADANAAAAAAAAAVERFDDAFGWVADYTLPVVAAALRQLFVRPGSPYVWSDALPPAPTTAATSRGATIGAVGSAELQGRRPYMEDRVILMPRLGDGALLAGTALLAICDGHGGDRAADFVSRVLPGAIAARLLEGYLPPSAMWQAFVDVDTPLCAPRDDDGDDEDDADDDDTPNGSGGSGSGSGVGNGGNGSGANGRGGDARGSTDATGPGGVPRTSSGSTCAAVLVAADGGVYCCNIGDSRAVVCAAGCVAVDLSRDHKATSPLEVAMVAEAGGFVHHDRVMGELAVGRALGDRRLKQGARRVLCGTPEVLARPACRGDAFIVVACDGVWDVMSSQTAVDFIAPRLLAGEDPSAVCRGLATLAIDTHGSDDNVSVCIALLPGAERALAPVATAIRTDALQPTSLLARAAPDAASGSAGGASAQHLAMSSSPTQAGSIAVTFQSTDEAKAGGGGWGGWVDGGGGGGVYPTSPRPTIRLPTSPRVASTRALELPSGMLPTETYLLDAESQVIGPYAVEAIFRWSVGGDIEKDRLMSVGEAWVPVVDVMRASTQIASGAGGGRKRKDTPQCCRCM